MGILTEDIGELIKKVSWGGIYPSRGEFRLDDADPIPVQVWEEDILDRFNEIFQCTGLSVGDLVLLPYTCKEKSDGLDAVFLHSFDGALGDGRLYPHSALVLAALEQIDPRGTVLELGSYDAVPGIVSLKRGADYLIAVDCDPKVEELMRQHMGHNDMDQERIIFIGKDLCTRWYDGVQLNNVDTIIANLGPHHHDQYNEAHIHAINMVDQTPNARYFIAGGYSELENGEDFYLSAKGDMQRLAEKGFGRQRIIRETEIRENNDIKYYNIAVIAQKD